MASRLKKTPASSSSASSSAACSSPALTASRTAGALHTAATNASRDTSATAATLTASGSASRSCASACATNCVMPSATCCSETPASTLLTNVRTATTGSRPAWPTSSAANLSSPNFWRNLLMRDTSLHSSSRKRMRGRRKKRSGSSSTAPVMLAARPWLASASRRSLRSFSTSASSAGCAAACSSSLKRSRAGCALTPSTASAIATALKRHTHAYCSSFPGSRGYSTHATLAGCIARACADRKSRKMPTSHSSLSSRANASSRRSDVLCSVRLLTRLPTFSLTSAR
ncbi:MAG: hypothetical protein J3K34DRAFT_431891 [Monoraphidium minutum]|nr:MAG: hypothetical protein J3K34DRAFT_431891 [Monoraphidium minutum]